MEIQRERKHNGNNKNMNKHNRLSHLELFKLSLPAEANIITLSVFLNVCT